MPDAKPRRALSEGYTIFPWMTAELGLRGPDLVVYAAVYSGGAKGVSMSTPALSYHCGISRNCLADVLRRLEARGLVRRAETGSGLGSPSRWIAPRAYQDVLPDYYDKI